MQHFQKTSLAHNPGQTPDAWPDRDPGESQMPSDNNEYNRSHVIITSCGKSIQIKEIWKTELVQPRVPARAVEATHA